VFLSRFPVTQYRSRFSVTQLNSSDQAATGTLGSPASAIASSCGS
jgi:hypothetical protein